MSTGFLGEVLRKKAKLETSARIDEKKSKWKETLKTLRNTTSIRKQFTNQPELFIMGDILSGTDFGTAVACKFNIVAGSNWTLLSGEIEGQTHSCVPQRDSVIFSHPLDAHFTTTSMEGWPKIKFEVLKLNKYGRSETLGYGLIQIPCCAGEFDIECPTWRPIGGTKDKLEEYFIERTVQLLSNETVLEAAHTNRCRISTTATGVLFLRLNIILRHFK
eukprot:TRINITY_DN2040_c0_g1_i2.p1 TRINITY_DN2040_c0_g1~~TRINITY_DN2040_c0_g1_i2.p1  ORF type:complete len:218 (+),score=26.87 TRINITY_DN2040_c0_g1_i2:312-965(+)